MSSPQTPAGRADVVSSSPQPPEEAAAARLIVCERSGRWAVALRRELADAGVRLYETRSLAECWAELSKTPAGFVVAELTAANAPQLLTQMGRLERDFPLVRLAVVADRSLVGYEWLMREAGAVHFTCSPRRLGPLAQLACRHLAQAPAPVQSLTERIWASLPWAAAAGPRQEKRITKPESEE